MNHKKDPECFPRLNPGSFFQEEKKNSFLRLSSACKVHFADPEVDFSLL